MNEWHPPQRDNSRIRSGIRGRLGPELPCLLLPLARDLALAPGLGASQLGGKVWAEVGGLKTQSLQNRAESDA
jgi:hypothetical protein